MPRFKGRQSALRRHLMADRVTTFCLITLTAIAVATALSVLRMPLIPFVLAIFLTYIVAPMVDLFQTQLKLPRWAALGLTFIVTLLALGFVVLFVLINLQSLLSSADLYQARLIQLAEDVTLLLQRYRIPVDYATVVASIRGFPIFSTLTQAAGQVVNILSSGSLVMIFLFFLVMGSGPANRRHGVYAEIDLKIQQYLSMKLATSAATGILVGIALGFLRVELAFMFGLLAFLLNFIPTLGSIIATLLPLPVALLQFENPVQIALVLIIPGSIQAVLGSMLEPKLFSDSLDLHPASILLALIFWGIIWGPVGMFLAVPILVVLKIALSRLPATEAIAELLAGRLPFLGANA